MQERSLQMPPPLQRYQWLYAFSLPYRVVRMVHTTALRSFSTPFAGGKRQAPRWSPATPRPSTPPAAREHARHGLAAQPDFAIFSWRVGDESTSAAKHGERQ